MENSPDVKLRRFGAGNWYALPRGIPQDERLIAEAVAVLVYLLSKPDDWDARPSDIQRRFNWGRDKWQGVAKNLEKAGYLRRVKGRAEDGQFLHFIEYADTPAFLPLPENPVMDTTTGKTVAGSAVAGSAVAGKPGSVHDRDKYKTEIPQKTEGQPPAPGGDHKDPFTVPPETVNADFEALKATIILLTGETGEGDWRAQDLVCRQAMVCQAKGITPEGLREFAKARPGKVKLRFLAEINMSNL